MININSVTLVGRITKEIELRKTQSNTSVCNFTVAVDRRFTQNGEKQADFISCIAWKQGAEFLDRYATKGTIVSVEGRIQTRTYDGQNGKVYVTEVVADHVQIISQRNQESATAQSNQTPAVNNEEEPNENLTVDDDDLPFY